VNQAFLKVDTERQGREYESLVPKIKGAPALKGRNNYFGLSGLNLLL
jgi:hypothetical protein